MRKYSDSEGKLEVLRGEEAVVVNEHLSKTGKAVSDFDDSERQALHADLDRVRGSKKDDSVPETESE
jgi:hypothetical protein